MIIKSMINDDLYKISMMNYVLELFPNTEVTYKFKNRGSHRFNQEFLTELKREIDSLSNLKLTDEEYFYLKEKFPYLTHGFLEYLKNFRYNPKNVIVRLTEDNNLELEIKGLWVETIKFEVVLMAIISELYFKIIDTKWNYGGQEEKALEKINRLSENNCFFVDMGSRRRKSFKNQELVIETFTNYSRKNANSSFLGTSNIYLARKYGLKCFGSQAHEITQATQVLNSYNHCNYYTMENWLKIFPNLEIGTALSDTITVDAFLKDFNKKLSTLYKSVRHDSGDPYIFIDKMIKHYEKMDIYPQEKTLIFSDGLNVQKAIDIKKYCEKKIKCSFGIGTHFTGDFGENSPALNMVIKLWSVNNFPVVKLGDDGKGKENGDPTAVEFMRWIVKNQLDL